MFSISRSLIFTFLIALCNVNGAKITLEQMQQATEPIRLVCMQKSKVSEDALATLRAGKLEDQKELKCYVNCVLEMMQTVRKRLSVVNNTCS
jgi:PBP/GOBP family